MYQLLCAYFKNNSISYCVFSRDISGTKCDFTVQVQLRYSVHYSTYPSLKVNISWKIFKNPPWFSLSILKVLGLDVWVRENLLLLWNILIFIHLRFNISSHVPYIHLTTPLHFGCPQLFEKLQLMICLNTRVVSSSEISSFMKAKALSAWVANYCR